MPNWLTLKRLLHHANGLHDAELFQAQFHTIEEQRQLLDDPDPVTPLVSNIAQLLRKELNQVKAQLEQEWSNGDSALDNDPNWAKLEPEQKYELRSKQHLIEAAKPEILVQDTQAILQSIDKFNLTSLRDRIAALPSRFAKIRQEAAKLCEPEAQFIEVPSRTLKDDTDIKAWLAEVTELLSQAIKHGPVVVK
ncbi:MAG: hypothetical protein WCJ40_15340 [Planctomycetota bacterium]